MICEDSGRAHRQYEEDAQSAGHASAGIKNECDGRGIHAGIDDGHDAQGRPIESAGNDQEHAG